MKNTGRKRVKRFKKVLQERRINVVFTYDVHGKCYVREIGKEV